MSLLVCNEEQKSGKEHPGRCTHEEADDRIIFHLSHSVKVGKFKSIAIASPDTDVFVYFRHNMENLCTLAHKSCGV